MAKIKGFVVDSNKFLGSYAQRSRGDGSYGFIGNRKKFFSKTAYGPFRPQGSFITKAEARKFKLNKDELIKVQIDKKDLNLNTNSFTNEKYVFPKYGKKYEIIEKNYTPNRLNTNNYLKNKNKGGK